MTKPLGYVKHNIDDVSKIKVAPLPLCRQRQVESNKEKVVIDFTVESNSFKNVKFRKG